MALNQKHPLRLRPDDISLSGDVLVRTDVGIAITLIQPDPIVDSRTIAPGTS